MRKKFLILILILFGSFNFIAQNRSLSKIVSPASTYSINLQDSVILDLKKSYITGYSNDSSYLNIPLFIKVDNVSDIVNSLDFAFYFDEAKLTFDSIIDLTSYIQTTYYFNPNDRKLRVATNSLTNYDKNKTLFIIKFKIFKSCVVNIIPKDFNTFGTGMEGFICGNMITTKTSQSSIQANFNASAACLNTPVSFTDASFGSSITSWYWKFGNGLTSTLKNPTTTYTNSGTYTVSLLVTSGGVCKDSLQKIITVSNPPVSSFSYSIDCVKDSVFFTNTSTIPTGTITNWSWNFGDSGTSSVKNPVHHYNAAGNFTVSLLTTSNASCTSTYTTAIILNKPTANFIVPNNNCQDAIINFTNTSTYTLAPITSYNWDFGDGTISTLQNPTHTYTTSGTYTVLLVCTSTVGCSGSISKIITINAKPIVQYTASVLSGCSPLAVSFNDQSTTDLGSTYYWVFGDNGNSTIQNPSHAYTNSGIYTVKEVVTTSKGCKDSLIKTSYITVNSSPIVNFSISNGCINSGINFIDNSAVTSGTITSWNWNFGDGVTSSIQNPIHTYTTAGTYTVILNVSTSLGCSSTLTKTITISGKPIVNFVGDNLIGCSPLVVTFTNSTTNTTGATYIWNFGDGGTSSLQNPVHTFTTNGLYTIKLVVTSLGGCSDSLIKTAYINANGTAATANFAVINGCANSVINFTNTSTANTGTITSFNWNFGDGGLSSLQNPSHTYTNGAVYSITLTVTNNQGCVSAVTKTVTIDNKPIVNFSVDNTDGCYPFTVNFTGTSITTLPSTYLWSFGDTNFSTLKDANNTYTTTGSYTIKYIVKTQNGCIDSLIKSNYIKVQTPPKALFSMSSNTVLIQNPKVLFTNLSSNYTSSLWNFGDFNNSIITNPNHTYADTGLYKVCLTVTNQIACSSKYCDSVLVIKNGGIVAVPSAFTPNADNNNDILQVKGGPFSEFEFKIFNEWGNILFESKDQKEGWNGYYQGVMQENGVYEYTLKGKTVRNESINLYGPVNLVR